MLRRNRSRTRSSSDGSADERLRALIDEHAPAIYRVALSVVRDPSLAEDVVQETIIKAWRNLDSVRAEGSERSWMLRIAHNTSVSMLRRIRDEATDPRLLPDLPGGLDPDRHVQGREELARLPVVLDSLDELSRSILVLRDLEGLSYEQIAATLEVPLPTVKTRLLRARRELQRLTEAGDRA